MRTFVRAYTADADIWCIDCADEAYGEETDQSSKRTVSVNAVDGEGNPVSPVFPWDLRDWDYPPTCGNCGKGLGER